MDEKTIATRALLYAREAIAAKKDADGAPHSAASVRAGEWDGQHEVKDAALGARAVLASLSQAGAGGVAVKPLAWTHRFASTGFCSHYKIDKSEFGGFDLIGPDGYALKRYATEDDARDAGDVDYASRIRSALAASPSAGEDAHPPDFDAGYQWVRDASHATPPAPVQTASVEAVLAALQPFARAIAPDADTICGWRFGVTPEHTDFVRAYEVYHASLTAPTQGAPEPGRPDYERQSTLIREFVDRQIAAVTPSSPVSSPSPAGGVRGALTFDEWFKGLDKNVIESLSRRAVACTAWHDARRATLSSPSTPDPKKDHT